MSTHMAGIRRVTHALMMFAAALMHDLKAASDATLHAVKPCAKPRL
jgi:predicted protein tyrosine phosphatase